MRLIDADALREMFPEDYDRPLYHFTGIWAAINVCPAIDAAPVRRGEWGVSEIVGYDGVNAVYAAPCSACGEFSKEAHLFCPNCGADMRKEERHEPED